MCQQCELVRLRKWIIVLSSGNDGELSPDTLAALATQDDPEDYYEYAPDKFFARLYGHYKNYLK